MKTQKFTLSQLNEAIAIARGWKWVHCPNSIHDKRRWLTTMTAPELELIGAVECGEDIERSLPMNVCPPDYTGSMDTAMPLLRELENYEITGYEYGKSFNGCRRLLRFMRGSTWQDVPWIIGIEAQAIAAAWYQWKFGVIVEIVSE